MLSCEYHRSFKNAYFEEQLQMDASEFWKLLFSQNLFSANLPVASLERELGILFEKWNFNIRFKN